MKCLVLSVFLAVAATATVSATPSWVNNPAATLYTNNKWIQLTCLGKDNSYNESQLTYTWTQTQNGAPTATLGANNGTNKAKSLWAILPLQSDGTAQPGTYVFSATVKNPSNQTISKAAPGVVVGGSGDPGEIASIEVWPPTITAKTNNSVTFRATARTSSGKLSSPQPQFTWTLSNGGSKTVSPDGRECFVPTYGASSTACYVSASAGTQEGYGTFTVGDKDALLNLAKQKIQYVIVIMQENRSFDNYFGTYPGSDNLDRVGLIAENPTRFVLNTTVKGETVYGHENTQAEAELASGNIEAARKIIKADGYIAANSGLNTTQCFAYHDGTQIPNYWAMAKHFVLQDRMFQPEKSYSLPSHLYMVSGWSANCSGTPCVTEIRDIANGQVPTGETQKFNPMPVTKTGAPLEPTAQRYRWSNIADLLTSNSVGWGYFLGENFKTSCTSCDANCFNGTDPVWTYWNAMKWFQGVDKTISQRKVWSSSTTDVTTFMRGLRNTTLPAVSWIVPGFLASEHPGSVNGTQTNLKTGHNYVTSIIKMIMQYPNIWNNCAIFISWDDWGGYYDHVVPPTVDNYGYGPRVPGLMISPYAKQGMVDHQPLSHDAYLKFIEDRFTNGQRLGGDGRPTVREDSPFLGDLLFEFDFNQSPRTPDAFLADIQCITAN